MTNPENTSPETLPNPHAEHGTDGPPARSLMPYHEVQLGASGADPSASQEQVYDTKGKVIVAIRRLLRSGRSLRESDVASEFPELVEAVKVFFKTWTAACYASGVSEHTGNQPEPKALKRLRQVQWRPGGPPRKIPDPGARQHVIDQLVKLVKERGPVTSGDFLKAYGSPSYNQMLQQFGRFVHALAAAHAEIGR